MVVVVVIYGLVQTDSRDCAKVDVWFVVAMRPFTKLCRILVIIITVVIRRSLHSVLWHCWLDISNSIQPIRKLGDEVTEWESVVAACRQGRKKFARNGNIEDILLRDWQKFGIAKNDNTHSRSYARTADWPLAALLAAVQMKTKPLLLELTRSNLI